uniref:Uncharacterized protein n=1 Tax=Anguilla anguilla TaxID=7936 RepID=A0A0E9XN58_ANGAN
MLPLFIIGQEDLQSQLQQEDLEKRKLQVL